MGAAFFCSGFLDKQFTLSKNQRTLVKIKEYVIILTNSEFQYLKLEGNFEANRIYIVG